ncbi:Ricin B lectin domain-containing protein OS=Streptomyces microflavus OX=1919 GN=Smic_68970 PE=4 SV=1 [Streptomyces microflavus]
MSFPLGTDPNQSWYSGDYPIVWTNKNYRMLYANFGHNAMNYATNTPLSSTFASATQNTFLLIGLTWLGTGSTGNPGPDDPISPTAWYSLTSAANGRCADTRAAATANGTVVQQYACNGTIRQAVPVPADGRRLHPHRRPQRSGEGGGRDGGLDGRQRPALDVLQLWHFTRIPVREDFPQPCPYFIDIYGRVDSQGDHTEESSSSSAASS